MVEKLYGVISTGSSPFGEVNIKPSPELFGTLARLPKGAKVGLQILPEHLNQNVIERLLVSTYYWEELIKDCQDLELDIVYLEDAETLSNASEKIRQASQTKDEKEAYRLAIEGEYELWVERERKIFDNIAEHDPDVVIIGSHWADNLLSNPEEFTSRGLTAPEILFEEISGSFSMLTDPILTHVNNGHAINRAEMLRRELLVRSYRALKEGRVTEKEKPNFIGSWDLTIPERGLFEVFVDETDGAYIMGTIEDCLGTATFTGMQMDGQIEFTKIYDPENSSRQTAPIPITYRGEKSGDKYVGTYEVEGQYWGGFEMAA